MKQPQNARKPRPRNMPRKSGGKNHSNGNPGNRTENKSRGNPKQQLEKYKNQARDALQAGDRVGAEYYFQFADHYQRLLNEMQPVAQPQQQPQQAQQQDDDGQRGRRGRERGRRDDASQSPPKGSQGQAAPAKAPRAKASAEKIPTETAVETPAAAATPANPSVDEKPVELAKQDQPAEVHPELDLGAEVPEKPKRKTPVRRKRAPKKVVEPAEPAADAAKDDEAA